MHTVDSVDAVDFIVVRPISTTGNVMLLNVLLGWVNADDRGQNHL